MDKHVARGISHDWKGGGSTTIEFDGVFSVDLMAAYAIVPVGEPAPFMHMPTREEFEAYRAARAAADAPPLSAEEQAIVDEIASLLVTRAVSLTLKRAIRDVIDDCTRGES